jgi:hypothetical protein
MQAEQHLAEDADDLYAPVPIHRSETDRGIGGMKCAICAGPLADHEIGDHESRVVERMLRIGFPTPVGSRLS